MKIGLIVAANLNHAPYVNHYVEILKKNDIDYEILEFNKLGLINDNPKVISYDYMCDYKEGILKKIYGYFKFKKFCIKLIKNNQYAKLIVFIPQYGMFIQNFLSKNYKNNYILDVRDYNSFFKYKKKFLKLVSDSAVTVISSEGFKNWLPNAKEYLLNHNIELSHIKKISEKNTIPRNKLKILNTGVIRSYNENLYLIRQLKNSEKISLEYRGESSIARDLKNISEKESIFNCDFYGAYKKSEEIDFYENADMINIMQTNDFLSKDAMPNRFYNALMTKKPILATSENLIGDLVEKYDLGIVVSKELRDEKLESRIIDFFENFDREKFEKKCDKLIEKVIIEEKKFEEKILKILKILK